MIRITAAALWVCLVWLGASLGAQTVSFQRSTVHESGSARMRSGAILAGEGDKPHRLLTWGDGMRVIPLPKGRVEQTSIEAPVGPGGCVVDVNMDGLADVVAYEPPPPPGKGADASKAPQLGSMVWYAAPDWKRHLIDTEAQFRDCMGTLMFGKRGILIVHRFAQVRFYEVPEQFDQKWPYREIYSIYTPSDQGGLLRADVDGDGQTDILTGNYWLRSPQTPDGQWRLFAINKWWEKQRSAMLRLAMAKPNDTPFPVLFAAEAEARPARLAWFERPADPTQFWNQTSLDTMPALARPSAILTADLNGDLRPDLVVGENNGAKSRLLVFWGLGSGSYQATRVDEMPGVTGLWTLDLDADGDLDIVGLSRNRVVVWYNQRRK
ncbi:MAG: FG-GAP-like repeat-containing protein [Bryobacteraceae bacterium]